MTSGSKNPPSNDEQQLSDDPSQYPMRSEANAAVLTGVTGFAQWTVILEVAIQNRSLYRLSRPLDSFDTKGHPWRPADPRAYNHFQLEVQTLQHTTDTEGLQQRTLYVPRDPRRR